MRWTALSSTRCQGGTRSPNALANHAPEAQLFWRRLRRSRSTSICSAFQRNVSAMHWKIFALSLGLTASVFAQNAKHPFTFEDMMKMKRVGAPVPSPEGKWVEFDCVDVDLEANTRISHLWIVAASGPAAAGRRLNPTPNHEERPRFSPDGKRLIWTSKATDPTQIWMCDFDSGSGVLVGKPHQLTEISTGADGGIWSPDGKNIVFVSAVYPDCKDDACNKQRDEELKKSKVKAKIFTRLFYRHWNAFTEFKRSHLFVISADAAADRNTDLQSVRPAESNSAEADKAQTAENISAGRTGQSPVFPQPRDLTPGDHDVPPFHLGVQDMYAISPDGQELAYTSNIDEVEAASTNNEIFIVPITGGAPKRISTSSGSDATPLYSADGKYIAWRSQARAGFEADKQSLIIYERDRGQMHNATASWDRSVGSLAWASDSKRIFFSAEDHGESPIWEMAPDEKEPHEVVRLHADDLAFSKDGRVLFFTRVSTAAPTEIARLEITDYENATGHGQDQVAAAPVTHINEALLAKIDMQPLESFTFKGANNDDVQGFIIKPPGFDPNKKYPLKFLIHGGPQGAWGNSWTYRWNAELFAVGNPERFRGQGGYAVVMINFHGSTGYGQKFTDSISGDWGGKPYTDLMKGLDYVEKTFPFIDKNREAALARATAVTW